MGRPLYGLLRSLLGHAAVGARRHERPQLVCHGARAGCHSRQCVGARSPPASLRGGSITGRVSNLYVGGLPVSAQPAKHTIGAGQYKDRFPDAAKALEACRVSVSCKGYEEHCRAIPYILTQQPCPSDTTMLCDESAKCAHSKSLHDNIDCETESTL